MVSAQSPLGQALPKFKRSGKCHFIAVCSFKASQQRHSQSHLLHSQRHLYRSHIPSTASYPCKSHLRGSASVTSHCAPFRCRLPILYKVCPYLFSLPPQNRILFQSTPPHSNAPHVRATTKPSGLLYHSSYLSH